MISNIPQFHEIRITLTELDAGFREFIGGPDVIDIGQTIGLMLRDYFNGEVVTSVFGYQTYSDRDRTLVFPFGKDCTFNPMELATAIEVYGEIFWSMADLITNKVLRLTVDYVHKPSECFYKFFPATRELVVYTPIIADFTYGMTLTAFDGRAVITACADTLPPHLRFT